MQADRQLLLSSPLPHRVFSQRWLSQMFLQVVFLSHNQALRKAAEQVARISLCRSPNDRSFRNDQTHLLLMTVNERSNAFILFTCRPQCKQILRDSASEAVLRAASELRQLVHSRQQVTQPQRQVQLGGEVERRVPHQLRDDSNRHAIQSQQSKICVPQRVEVH